MRFSAKERYAVRSMIDLALHDGNEPVSAKVIAERQDISADYLEQIFRLLRKAGMLESMRGPRGGFSLARSPSEITVWDIVEALGEPVSLAPCQRKGRAGHCERSEYCAAQVLWENLGEGMRDLLQKVTLDSIVESARDKLNASPSHGHVFHI